MTRLSKSSRPGGVKPSEQTAQQLTAAHSKSSSKAAEVENPAMLAQRLGSESSWADQYVPSTPTETVMTPTSSSVADYSEAQSAPDEHKEPPPAYELSAGEGLSPNPVGPSKTDDTLQSVQERRYEDESNHVPVIHGNSLADVLRERRIAFRKRLVVCILLTIFIFIFTITKLTISQGRQQPIFNHPKPLHPPSPIPTRDFSRHETSQSITGTFTLYDSLDLSTTSGSINIAIDLKPGTNPAVLNLSSQSGSINVRLADRIRKISKGKCDKSDKSGEGAAAEFRSVTNRQFHTNIKTTSGSVRLDNYIHGNGGYTKVETKSGSINLWLWTIGSGMKDNTSSLLTTSTTGSHHINLTPSIFDSDDSAGAIRAVHHSLGSASMHLSYPKTWEGLVHASCVGSGSVRVKGEGMEYQHHGDREVYAWRGNGANDSIAVEAKSDGSGSINFSC